MSEKKGQLSVRSENIFPIIRQWLYSEQEIFIRELVSNAVDALSKRAHLLEIAQSVPTEDELRCLVILDEKAGTLTVRDNGIGMNAEEVNRYINQIAYSGLLDFVDKYQNKGNGGQAVIGHFGLGFYSAFMVADKVEIETLSCLQEQKPVHWESEEGIEYLMSEGKRETVGTDIILHLSKEAKKDLSVLKVRALLKKYCGFMARPVSFQESGKESEQINQTEPLWLKPVQDVQREEYIEFYQNTFGETDEPLFWIHLNMDFPFRLKGILYFPSVHNPYMSQEGRILVYSRQVFVADNMREMIPDFLFLLQGCLDCPDLPLNVSRSYLQNDETVQKLSRHIVKKVGDKLLDLFKENREKYEQLWPHLSRFIKIGSLQDPGFAAKMKDITLIKNRDEDFKLIPELPEGDLFYMFQDKPLETYAAALKQDGRELFVMEDEWLDLQWMSLMEMLFERKYRFKRADSELSGEMEADFLTDEMQSLLTEQFGKSLRISARKLNDQVLPAVLTESEESRRFRDLKEIFSRVAGKEQREAFEKMNTGEIAQELTLNTVHPLSKALKELTTAGEETKSEALSRYILDLALLSRHELQGDEFTRFLKNSQKLVEEGLK